MLEEETRTPDPGLNVPCSPSELPPARKCFIFTYRALPFKQALQDDWKFQIPNTFFKDTFFKQLMPPLIPLLITSPPPLPSLAMHWHALFPHRLPESLQSGIDRIDSDIWSQFMFGHHPWGNCDAIRWGLWSIGTQCEFFKSAPVQSQSVIGQNSRKLFTRCDDRGDGCEFTISRKGDSCHNGPWFCYDICASELLPITIISSLTSADIAQLGERKTEDLKVPGSIPGVGIFFALSTFLGKFTIRGIVLKR